MKTNCIYQSKQQLRNNSTRKFHGPKNSVVVGAVAGVVAGAVFCAVYCAVVNVFSSAGAVIKLSQSAGAVRFKVRCGCGCGL